MANSTKRIDGRVEIANYIKDHKDVMATSIDYILGQVLNKKRRDSKVNWTLNDGSFCEVQFRRSDVYNFDMAACVPVYTLNGDGANPNYSVCMSLNGKIFAVIDNFLAYKNHFDDVQKYTTRGFVGYKLYKNWEDCVSIIHV